MDIQRLTQHIKRHEGLRLELYTCPAGKLTIGYGHNVEDNGIPEQIAEALLMYDLHQVERELARVAVFQQLDSSRRTVLLDMAFNMGTPTLLGFRRMWAALERRDYPGAADEMVDSAWYRQVPNRAGPLVTAMRSGEFPNA